MCGIVGLFLKDKSLEPKLGEMLTDMLITMSDRGPDSAGIAVYGKDDAGHSKLTVQAADPSVFDGLDKALGKALDSEVGIHLKDT
ncbi:MAG: glutamine amidotransferase, partial [Pseudomonadota bacterium]